LEDEIPREAQNLVLPIARLYTAILGRDPEPAGLNNWVNAIRGGTVTLESASLYFLSSPEASSKFGFATATNFDFVQKLYQLSLGRPGEKAGVDHWLEKLDKGLATRPEVANYFANSPENIAKVGSKHYVASDTALETLIPDSGSPSTATGTGIINLSSLDGTNGFHLKGVATSSQLYIPGLGNLKLGGDLAGNVVSSAGDVNGDGFDDMMISAPSARGGGAIYVVFGRASGFAADINLSDLNGTNGFYLKPVDKDFGTGGSINAAGDINGDGFGDVIIGADRAQLYAGTSYVVFGKASGFSSSMALSGLSGTNGFRFDGVRSFGYTGASVKSAGDINGDGFSDVIIGSSGGGNVFDTKDFKPGSSYIVFGKASEFPAIMSASDLNGRNGFSLTGEKAGDFLGVSVSSAGDVNADGLDDLIVGAMSVDPNFSSLGASYVVFGKASGFASNINLSTLNGTDGFRLHGYVEKGYTGVSVSSAGDVNGDGFTDLIIGRATPDGNKTDAGSAYVVFGKASGFAANIELSNLNGANGFRIDGVTAGDQTGRVVAAQMKPREQTVPAFETLHLPGGSLVSIDAASDFCGRESIRMLMRTNFVVPGAEARQ
jgi:hypothetical protein